MTTRKIAAAVVAVVRNIAAAAAQTTRTTTTTKSRVLTMANYIDASKVSREDVAPSSRRLQNRKATENVTISIAGANKATAGMKRRRGSARGAHWETQAITRNVQILSKWSDLDA